MSDESQQQQIDPNLIGCRIVDVHVALQNAFTSFAQGGDDTLEGLARKIHESLSEMPVFLMGSLPPPPEESK
jgi:hypothetical protein